VKLFISEIVHTEDSFLLKLYYKFNFATEPSLLYMLLHGTLCLSFELMIKKTPNFRRLFNNLLTTYYI
ncbi:hypothetical protein CD137_09395, partial [Staphylococcus petrasii]